MLVLCDDDDEREILSMGDTHFKDVRNADADAASDDEHAI